MMWNTLKQKMQRLFSSGESDQLDPAMLSKMARGIMSTRPDEIGCEECFAEMDQFVELTLVGKNAAEAMPLVQDHLDRCKNCREEYEALLEALRALA
jgi:hypothetical protein